MSLSVKWTSKFKKDYKTCQSRGLDISLLNDIIIKLSNKEELSKSNSDHSLSGEWNGFRECHIKPDWLLIYYITDTTLTLTLSRTGTHSDLFK